MKIAFTGKAGSGKSTIASELVKRNNYIKFAFADRLKEIAEELKMDKLNKFESKDRKLLQMLGTDIGRELVSDDLWVRQLDKKIKDFFESEYAFEYDFNKIVIDDCRFLNEAKWLTENDYLLIRIVGRGYNLNSDLAGHRSEMEQEQIEVDFELDNSGTLDETMTKLYNFINKQ